MKKTFVLAELYGEAWNRAIENVGKVLGRSEKESKNSWYFISNVASKLGVRFDCNGNIVK